MRGMRRWIALGTLLVWVSAFGLCTVHCALGKGAHIGTANPESLPPCHGSGAPHSDSSKHSSDSSGSFCLTTKTLYLAVADLGLHAPDALAFVQPVFAALSVAEVEFVESAQLLRQSRAPDWVFTPEVYLGPAFRSHAPPVLL